MSHSHHNHTADSYTIPEAIWTRVRNILGALFLLGWAASLAGLSSNHAQFFQSYLVAFFFAFSIVIGGTLFTMIQHLTGSAWSVPVRRIMETIMMSFPVLALLTLGEGWHNNHHGDQRAAAHGRRWFEIDMTYWMIKGLSMIGLASEIVPVRASMDAKPRQAD